MKIFEKKIITIAFLLLAYTFSFGQTIDVKSQSILNSITNHYKSKNNSYFKFTYATGTPSKISQTQTGIFYSNKDKYKLKIMGVEQIFDGNKIYNINDEDKEITISKPNDSQQLFSPLSYLDSYKKDYNVKYAGKKTISGIAVDVIKLTPINANGIKTVTLYVNTAQKKLIKLEQVSSNNDLAVITISDYRDNQKLAADLFTYNKAKYQNYLITEL